ncbi:MAG: hypothetical protein Q9184_006350 [Pyrenodesmia sp. 2 TL-2023]
MPPTPTPAPFLGAITEVCIVTPDHIKTMDGLLRLGIGPFQVFDFTPATVSCRRFRGQDGDFELKVCFAKQGDLVFEIMQPVAGGSGWFVSDSPMIDIKRNNKEGIQHLAFDCGKIPMAERKREMRARGFEPAMEGVWKGRKGTCTFCFFDTEASAGTVFESIAFSDDWEDPEFELYPPGASAQDK